MGSLDKSTRAARFICTCRAPWVNGDACDECGGVLHPLLRDTHDRWEPRSRMPRAISLLERFGVALGCICLIVLVLWWTMSIPPVSYSRMIHAKEGPTGTLEALVDSERGLSR